VFTNRYFTASAQSTSHNEGENSILKRLFGTSNLLLCELFDALKERYQEESDYSEFISWKQSISQIGFKNAAKAIFESVVKQLNEFVMPNIIMKQEEQMNLSLYYHVMEIDFEVTHSIKKINFLFVIFKFYNLMIKNIQLATYSISLMDKHQKYY